MKLLGLVVISLALRSRAASADKHDGIDTLIEALSGARSVPDGTKPPRIYVGPYGAADPAPAPYEPALQPEWTATVKSKIVAYTADKQSGWITADVKIEHICVAMGCPATDPHPSSYHATIVFDVGKPLQPVAVHTAEPGKDKDAAVPPELPRKIDAGAEDVAKLFESTLGDPKALVATVSDRKETTLYGSDATEKYVGGAKVKSTLTKWNLAFKVRDGVQAGLAASKTLAWVVANVDARSTKQSAGKPTPYRVLVVYEKTNDAWRVVAAQFSLYVSTI